MISQKILDDTDEQIFNDWLGRDKLHQALGITFAMTQAEGCKSYIISDTKGPLMAARIHQATRVAFQFDAGNKYRTAKVAPAVLEWLTALAKNSGSNEIIIRPGGDAVRFADGLGFSDFNGKILEIN